MASVGIIANPASGKDIRRLVAYATVIDNNEKVNIVKRIVLAVQDFGVDEVFIMPDSFMIGSRVTEDLTAEGVLSVKCTVLDMPITSSSLDTTEAASRMAALGAGCVLVLGGDGTSRAAAKGIGDVPIIPISTGTNNAYTSMVEGTVAGMAAAAAAGDPEFRCTCIKDKVIEVYINGSLADIALVDVVLSSDRCVGARAIWEMSSINRVMVTKSHPANIGFSAAVGAVRVVLPEDDYGYMFRLGGDGVKVKAALAAGIVEQITVSEQLRCELGMRYRLPVDEGCMLALDGEREIPITKHDSVELSVDRKGPWRVDIRKTLERALDRGFFKQKV